MKKKEPEQPKIHDLIKEERERQGITKYKLSKALNTSQGYYAKLEQGKHSPSFDKVIEICKELKMSITILPNGDTKINNNASK